MSAPNDWEFYRHMPVYLDNRRLLGRVQEVGHAFDFIHVQHGHILVRDWYIPVGAIRLVNGEGVYLSADARELRRNGWDIPPAPFLERQGATPGYEYTSPADVETYRAHVVASGD